MIVCSITLILLRVKLDQWDKGQFHLDPWFGNTIYCCSQSKSISDLKKAGSSSLVEYKYFPNGVVPISGRGDALV